MKVVSMKEFTLVNTTNVGWASTNIHIRREK